MESGVVIRRWFRRFTICDCDIIESTGAGTQSLHAQPQTFRTRCQHVMKHRKTYDIHKHEMTVWNNGYKSKTRDYSRGTYLCQCQVHLTPWTSLASTKSKWSKSRIRIPGLIRLSARSVPKWIHFLVGISHFLNFHDCTINVNASPKMSYSAMLRGVEKWSRSCIHNWITIKS